MPSLKAIITGDASHFIGQLKMVDSYTERLALRVRTRMAAEKELQNYGASLANRIASRRAGVSTGQQFGPFTAHGQHQGPPNPGVSTGQFFGPPNPGVSTGQQFGPGRMSQNIPKSSGFMVGGIVGGGGTNSRLSKSANSAVGASMFMSIARDSAASLASGAPITQVIAQQAPQALQALAIMRMGIIGIGVAAAAAGTAIAYVMVKNIVDAHIGTKKLEQSFKDLAAAAARFKYANQARVTDQMNELDEKLAAMNRRGDASKFEQDAADASADRLKQEITAEALLGKRIMTKKDELDLEKKLLKVDEERAQGRLDAAASSVAHSKDVLAAEIHLKNLKAESDSEDLKQKEEFRKRNPNLKNAFFPSADDEIANANMRSKIKIAEANLIAVRKKHGGAEVDKAAADLLEIKNRAARLGMIAPSSSGTPQVTDRQRINAMPVGNAPLLDINRAQLEEQKKTNMLLRARAQDGF